MTPDPLGRRIRARLAERAAQGLERRRRPRPPPGCGVAVDFSSNDYLALRTHPAVKAAVAEAVDRWGWGAGASPLVSGYTAAHAELESALAGFLGRDAAAALPSGFQANLAAVTALADGDTAIWLDRLAHASLIDAARASGAHWRRYPHADAAWLAGRLAAQPADQPKLILTDSVFSMHGDVAPLPVLATVAANSGALLIVDEAHGFGVLGPDGRGAVAAAGLDQSAVPLVLVTFGKALGGAGAALVGRRDLVDAVVELGRSYVYSTAPPPAAAAAAAAALDVMQREPWRREHLHRVIARWRERAGALGLAVEPGHTPIQAVPCRGPREALALSARLAAAGLHVPAMRPPSVPPRDSRLRITLTAAHSLADVDRLAETLARIGDSRGARRGHA